MGAELYGAGVALPGGDAALSVIVFAFSRVRVEAFLEEVRGFEERAGEYTPSAPTLLVREVRHAWEVLIRLSKP